jgi:hypothetical protein
MKTESLQSKLHDPGWPDRGKWGALTHSGADPRRFSFYSDMATYANKKYGPNNWTYQWYPKGANNK